MTLIKRRFNSMAKGGAAIFCHGRAENKDADDLITMRFFSWNS